MLIIRIILLSAVCLFVAMSCSDRQSGYGKAVAEWTGREIHFPDSMNFVGEGMRPFSTADYTIVSYYDSVGCTGCRMKLQLWNDFMQRVDSVAAGKTVRLIIIAATEDVKELEYLKKRYGFQQTIVADGDDAFNKLNGLPKDMALQAFLLGRDNRVMLLGNPVDNPTVGNVYVSTVGEKSPEVFDLEIDIEPDYSYDFGEIGIGEVASHIFHLRNGSDSVLRISEVVSSCECTEGKVSKEEIPPGEEYEVEVSFTDSIPGDFIRTITLYYENRKPETRIEISGKINK